MKQIAKTEQINQRLRASYGPDANLNDLAVFETTMLTTQPIRKSYGLFKGARPSLSLMSEVAASVNAESIPLQLQHQDSELPTGRVFYAEPVNDVAQGLFAVDGAVFPDVVTSLNNGTIDQVSVGMANKRLTCSACGFDYMDPAHAEALYTLTCDEGHIIGEDGVHVFIDGLQSLFELSLVGKGASVGAKIVGPSDSVLQTNDRYRLAATANPGMRILQLSSPTMKDDLDMSAELTAAFTAASTAAATATAQLGVMTSDRDARVAELTAANATIATRDATIAELTAATTESVANKAGYDAAVVALTAEATTVLTAVGKLEGTTIPTDVAALLALIGEHRAAFAAIVPVNGKTTGAVGADKATATTTNGAFRAPKS